ncbi:nitroreductase family deazaflavin-dependent oxidoreductase [Ktedonobacter racemifer]|uniref:Nitroreductase n=1 Tax=Ktedonobacter racemifer DSM 44963 TaxID=485913 RepID=D6TVQ3_KTERA|nr:nitroreductase family deazaflavin-dependent oxidoreductase [Ktedonobacter racemifer]EFH84286.1 hypothetical protein Krac_5312 [Ktedonobacter racemifer DSM 44963]
MFPDRIRVFNKYVTNRVLRGLAILPFGPFALLRHVGRRSGKSYEIVIMVWPLNEGFVIALTYGPKVDWYRNVQAAGGCTVFWHRKYYTLENPETLDTETALTAFPGFFKMVLRQAGLQHFIYMKSVASMSDASSAPTPVVKS